MVRAHFKPKIGLVVPGLALGGGVPAVARFIKQTVARSGRFDLRVVSLSMATHDPCSVNLSSPRTWLRGVASTEGVWEAVPYSHVGAVSGELEFQRYRPRAALARALADCDLIQVVCGSPAWANAVIGLDKPVAMHVASRARIERRSRDARPHGMAGRWRKAMTEITDRLDDRALRHVDAIQVMNPWMLEYARNINTGHDVDLRYAPPGVDAELFRPLDLRAPMLDPYILCVARLNDARKNLGLLLEAYALLAPALRDRVRLVFAGSSSPPEAFWRRAEALGMHERISCISGPDQDALVRLYQGASVFALPSDEEGFGVVLLEAMACGVPVVSTRSGGPDGIVTDGEDGYLVPLDDAPALSAQLARLLQEPALNMAMGLQARQTIERRYQDSVAGAAFMDVWNRMAQKAGIA